VHSFWYITKFEGMLGDVKWIRYVL